MCCTSIAFRGALRKGCLQLEAAWLLLVLLLLLFVVVLLLLLLFLLLFLLLLLCDAGWVPSFLRFASAPIFFNRSSKNRSRDETKLNQNHHDQTLHNTTAPHHRHEVHCWRR